MATVHDTAAHDRWEQEAAKAPTRAQPPTTVSSVPVEALYTPDSAEVDFDAGIGYPGQYPYTRGSNTYCGSVRHLGGGRRM